MTTLGRCAPVCLHSAPSFSRRPLRKHVAQINTQSYRRCRKFVCKSSPEDRPTVTHTVETTNVNPEHSVPSTVTVEAVTPAEAESNIQVDTVVTVQAADPETSGREVVEAVVVVGESAAQEQALEQAAPAPEEEVKAPVKKRRKKKAVQEEVVQEEAPPPPAPAPEPTASFPIQQALVGVVLLAGVGVFLFKKKQNNILGKTGASGPAPTPAVSLPNATPDPEKSRKVLQKESMDRLNNLSDYLRSQVTADLSAQNLGDEGTAYVIEALAFNNTCRALDLSKNGIGLQGIAQLCEVVPTSAVQTLVLNTNSIGDEGAEILAKMVAADPNITALDLSGNAIGDKGAVALAEALRLNNNLVRLDLSSNMIEDEGAKALASALKENQSLQAFALSDNYVGLEGFGELSKALSKNNSVQELYFKGSSLGDEGVELLCDALKKRDCKLQVLDLANNGITAKGAVALGSVLETGSGLTDLNLYMNELGNEGIKGLAKALKVNKDLKTLDLGGNNIGGPGVEELATALKGHDKLSSLELGYNPIEAKGAQALAAVAKYDLKLETLKLGWCKIGEFDGAKAMSDLLMFNTTLTVVDLRGNKLGNNGAIHIGRALKGLENTQLRELDLGYNEIKDNGAFAIAQALKANPDNAVQELKLGQNYIQNAGVVALNEAVDMVFEMTGQQKAMTIHF